MGCDLPSGNNSNKDNQSSVNHDGDIEKQVDNDYLLLDDGVGDFKIGGSIPFPESSDNYEINEEVQIRMTEEGEFKETVYIVKKEGEEIMQLKLKYDFNTEQYTKNIDEIIVTSSLVKTPEGIGIGSTMNDFIKIYPDYDLWYTYVSGMYVIETKNINAQFILDKKDFIGELDITGDVITLKKSDFKQDAKILKIRVL